MMQIRPFYGGNGLPKSESKTSWDKMGKLSPGIENFGAFTHLPIHQFFVETTLPTPTFSAGSIIRNVGGMIRN
jgi:hypothetical protein